MGREIQNTILDNSFERLCSLGMLTQAFQEVKQNKGAPGIDRIIVSDFELDLERNLNLLQQELLLWNYKPQPVRRVEIPKPNGGIRCLGIPCVRDRIVQAAIRAILEPLFEPMFSESSFGFRPGRNQEQAVQAAREIVSTGKGFVVDIDLANFFDTINHDKLIGKLGLKIEDKRILKIIGLTLRSGVMKYDGSIEPTNEGSTQGSPLSPLLSNIYLDELDKELESRELKFCRYADDCNIFVTSKEAANRVMISISKFITNRLKLKVNEDKSKIAPSHKVKFLGMTIIGLVLAISMQSMNKAMATVKELTPTRTCLPIEKTIKDINRWYVGWSNYYKMTEYPYQLSTIEAHIRRRLRARLIVQKKQNRNLFAALRARGVSEKLARTAYIDKGPWAKSHFRAVERAYSNKWFAEEMGFKVRSGELLPHWKDLKVRVPLL